MRTVLSAASLRPAVMTIMSVFVLVLNASAPTSAQPSQACGTVLLSEDFESCLVGTWAGDCNGWQTWANGSSHSDFFVTNQEHVSGTNALQVSGSGSCWEGSAYKSFTGSRHILLQARMKASGDGPNGCHHYQNGLDISPALWSFDMPVGAYQGGLRCSVDGGGSFVAIDGFGNAVGQWHAVATELDYDTGQANFWLDGQLVWSPRFDTNVVNPRVWLRSGEGRGWFDDVLVCELAPDAVAPATWGRIKNLYR